MIGKWTKADADLLKGMRVLWKDHADWQVTDKKWTGSAWRLVIENSKGQIDTIGRYDVANGSARLKGSRVAPPDLRKGLPDISIETTLSNIRSTFREHQLTTPSFYR